MIGSSVVPGLPERCVTPSDCSNSIKALRPLIVFGVEGDVIQTARRTRGCSNVALPARPRQCLTGRRCANAVCGVGSVFTRSRVSRETFQNGKNAVEH